MQDKVVPITPQEVKKLAPRRPNEVIESVNKLLISNYKEGSLSTSIQQKDIVIMACEAMSIKVAEFDFDWLNFEDEYKKYGWIVTYSSPDRDQNFESFFKFKEK
ncbi:MAG: hypothetical protein WC679_02600 [Bacteroidales bacterium]|jgi:hypothetical protein